MKLVNYCLVLWGLWLGMSVARAQSCPSVPQPACSFVAIDNGSGLTVDALCVGRPVRFEPCTGRSIDASPPVFYEVLPGAGTFPAACSPRNQQPYIYTPSIADVGTVTVSEVANERSVPKFYFRTFQVYATPPPSFTIQPCPSGAVLVTLTDTNPYDSYRVMVGPTTQPIVRGVPLSIPINGATAVTVFGDYAQNTVCDGTATQLIPALALPQTPLFSNLTLQGALPGGATTLTVGNLPAGYLYTLQVDPASGGGFRPVQPIAPGTTSIALPAPVAGCYRIFRDDYCGTSPATSNTLCTLSLTGASARNRNQLLFNPIAGATYTVTREGAQLASVTAISGGLEDADVQCGTSYTYRVTATQPGGASVSNEVSIRTESAIPPAQPQLVASFDLNDAVVLTPLPATGTLPTGSTLRYTRTAGGAAASFGTSTTSQPLTDTTPLAQLLAQPPCYSVRLQDVCTNTSPESAPACPALLSAAAADPTGATTTLTWTAFSGPNASQPASYALQRLAADGAVLSTVPVSGNSFTDLTPADLQVVRYRLQVSGAGLPAGTFSYSNRASVARQLFVTIPTAFTPNGDGLNDVLEVKGRYLSNYTFVVVDRNGQEAFRGGQRSQTWDGTIRGHAPVPGAYVWRFQQNTEDGKGFSASGTVTILK